MSYAGDLTPVQAWEFMRTNPDAVLVDVRTEAEWRFVGIPDTDAVERRVRLVEWVDLSGAQNPHFVQHLRAELAGRGSAAPVLFICRSGHRSLAAAITATRAGVTPAYNVSDGFEGPLDESGHRGGKGWKAAGLPWRQT